MKIKNLFLRAIFNARQREVIWAALLFSAHTYKRRKNIEGFAEVQRVISETSKTLGVEERIYTQRELEEIIDKSSKEVSERVSQIAEKEYQRGRREVIQEIHLSAHPIAPFSINREEFSKEKCEGCSLKEKCDIYNVALKEEFEADEEDKKPEPSDENTVSQSSESPKEEKREAATGEALEIPESHTVSFKPCYKLKKIIEPNI